MTKYSIPVYYYTMIVILKLYIIADNIFRMKKRRGGGELNQMDDNNNKRTKRCIDCDNELVPEYGHEVVVCEDCLIRIKRQFWSSVNIGMIDKKS
jgi:hypothetical protein